MTMTDDTLIAILPIGEFDGPRPRDGFDGILRAVKALGPDLLIADPAADEAGARQFVKTLSDQAPDLLLIVPLRGQSARAIEAAAMTSPVPCLICPVQGGFALPSSALAVGAQREANVPVELLYAPPDLPDLVERLRLVVSAARAYTRVRRSRIGAVGDLFPNLVSCRYDPRVVRARLGVTIVPVPFDTVRQSMEAMAGQAETIQQARQEVTRQYPVAAADEEALDAGLRLHLALKQTALDQNLDGYATECWSRFPKELGLNPCLGFVEDAYTLACEGDVMLCIALLMVRHLTGRGAYVGDLYDVDLAGNLTLIHCGAPASLGADPGHTALGYSQMARERGFETVTCRPRLEPGLVTVFRFYGSDCDRLHLAMGNLVECEQSPTLTVKVKIAGDRWDFLARCLGNHYVVVSGDIRQELSLLCRWLGITIIET